MQHAAVSSMTFTPRRTPKDAFEFVVGKIYQYVDKPIGFASGGISFLNDDNSFKVVRVDEDGDAWSMDCAYGGVPAHKRISGRPWCCATKVSLLHGHVKLVDG